MVSHYQSLVRVRMVEVLINLVPLPFKYARRFVQRAHYVQFGLFVLLHGQLARTNFHSLCCLLGIQRVRLCTLFDNNIEVNKNEKMLCHNIGIIHLSR